MAGRYAIAGTSASGKRTLARTLANRLGAPHVELDELFHGPNWTAASENVFRARVREAIAGGNRESVRGAFLGRNSLFAWTVKTHGRRRGELRGRLAANPHLVVIQLRSAADADRWLGSVSRAP
jgi:ABC-type iron transport system FetAB ATPase subunit